MHKAKKSEQSYESKIKNKNESKEKNPTVRSEDPAFGHTGFSDQCLVSFLSVLREASIPPQTHTMHNCKEPP